MGTEPPILTIKAANIEPDGIAVSHHDWEILSQRAVMEEPVQLRVTWGENRELPVMSPAIFEAARDVVRIHTNGRDETMDKFVARLCTLIGDA